MSVLDYILDAPPDQGRYWLVIKAEDEHGKTGMISLHLDGSETPDVADKKFQDACAVARQEMAKVGGWAPCNYHVDGKPRTEYELAADAFLKKMTEIGWDGGVPPELPEFQKMNALRLLEHPPG